MNLGLNTNEMEVPTGFIVHPLKKLNYFQMQVDNDKEISAKS